MIERYVRRLKANRALSAYEISQRCAQEVRGVLPRGVPARTRWAVYVRLCAGLRTAGRARTAARDRWTPTELRVMERFARAVVSGRYRSVRQAAPDCRHELERLEPDRERFVTRSLIGVTSRLYLRVVELGRSPARVLWSRRELLVVESFARAVIRGEYATLRSAAPDCRRELARHRAAAPRTELAVKLRLQKVARQLDPARPTRNELRWTYLELRIADRYGRKVATGLYPHAGAAARDCLRELDRYAQATMRRVRRHEANVRRVLNERIRILNLPPSGRHWTAEEERVVDRYARAVAAGRFRHALAAAERCAAELNLLRQRHPGRYRSSYIRKVGTVHGRLWPRVAQLRYPWSHTKWTAAERRIAERHARAAVAHEYPSLMAAARACSEELTALNRPARRSGSKTAVPVRPMNAVRDMLVKCTRKLDWKRLPYRFWSEEERQIASPWVRKYILHRKGEAVADLRTLAVLVQARLDRRGYYRGLHACKMHLIEGKRKAALASPGQFPHS